MRPAVTLVRLHIEAHCATNRLPFGVDWQQFAEVLSATYPLGDPQYRRTPVPRCPTTWQAGR